MNFDDQFTVLNNGLKMPNFGLGTYGLENPDVITNAFDYGYRLFDCASFYQNEDIVGQALAQIFKIHQNIQRNDIFIISKIWWDEVDDVEAACLRSLKKLGVDYLDLYLVHWPIAIKKIQQQNGEVSYERMKLPMYKIWAQMESLVDKGLVKSIGISNFNVQSIWDMLSYARILPVCNEIELHPLCVQEKLVKFLKQQKIAPIAYCPIARGADTRKCPNICEHQIIKQICQKYQKSGAQILLNWGIQRGHVVIPKSNQINRIRENYDSLKFSITPEEVELINSIDEGFRICDSYPWLFNNSMFA